MLGQHYMFGPTCTMIVHYRFNGLAFSSKLVLLITSGPLPVRLAVLRWSEFLSGQTFIMLETWNSVQNFWSSEYLTMHNSCDWFACSGPFTRLIKGIRIIKFVDSWKLKEISTIVESGSFIDLMLYPLWFRIPPETEILAGRLGNLGCFAQTYWILSPGMSS